MRALGVMSLLLAGASAGIVVSDPSTVDRLGRKLGLSGLLDRAVAGHAMQPGPAEAGAEAQARSNRVFSPGQPLLVPQPVPQARGGQVVTEAPRSPSPVTAAPAAGSPVSTVETATLHPRAPTISPVPAPVLARKPLPPMDEAARANLARDLQTELKRVGCYDGNVDGDWGPAVKRAMKSFTERVNAVLPTEQPDHILLTLVRGHKTKACGVPCGAGEIAGDGGRCVPKAVIAQPPRKLETRQAAAGLRGEEAGTVQSTSGWTPTVSVPAPVAAARPAQDAIGFTERGQPPAAVGAAPLAGRMAVGGPGAVEATPTPGSVADPAAPAPAANGAAAAAAPAKPSARKTTQTSGGNGGGSQGKSWQPRSADRSFNNPRVVREFFFGHGG